MTLYVYVDNSNLWIEGMRISAVKKGIASDPQDAMKRNILDQGWTYDFGKLYKAICPPDARIGRSSLFGSRPPANDSLWDLARVEGFEVTVFDRNFANREKQVDVAIATQMVEDSFLYMKPGDAAVLVSGDRDYIPTIDSLRSRGFPTHVIFWEHATGRELKEQSGSYFPMDKLFSHISR